MRTINTTFKTFGASLLLLGLKGDSNATEILIDCAESLEEYQGTMAAMSITGPDDTVYPGDISLDGNGIVHWVVAARDCGIAGHGSARVDLVDDEGTVVASAEARTIVMKTNMQGVAPDQIANWTEAASVALQEARAALLDLIDLDTTATANEAARQLAETGRVSAETLRASAETARASAETARATAENTRASAESARATAENTRASAENTRIAAENARVSEFSTIEANAQAALSYIGPSEASSTASAAHEAGSYFIYNGKLYKAIEDIAIGDTITSGTNCAQVPGGAMGEVSNLKSAIINTECVLYGGQFTPALIQGGASFVNDIWTINKNSRRVTSCAMVLDVGDVISVSFGLMVNAYLVTYENGNFRKKKPIYPEFTDSLTILERGWYLLLIQRSDSEDTSALTPSEVASKLSVASNETIDKIYSKIDDQLEDVNNLKSDLSATIATLYGGIYVPSLRQGGAKFVENVWTPNKNSKRVTTLGLVLNVGDVVHIDSDLVMYMYLCDYDKGKYVQISQISNVSTDTAIMKRGWYQLLITRPSDDSSALTPAEVASKLYITSCRALEILHDDISTMQGDISTMQGDISTMQGDISTMQGDISTLQGDDDNLKFSVFGGVNNLVFEQGSGNFNNGAFSPTPNSAVIRTSYVSPFSLSIGDAVTIAEGYEYNLINVALREDGMHRIEYIYGWGSDKATVSKNGLYFILLRRTDRGAIVPSEGDCITITHTPMPVAEGKVKLHNNPYKNIVWDSVKDVTSVSHAHCETQTEFDTLQAHYDHVAISNYIPAKPYYPLSNWFTVTGNILASPNAEHRHFTGARTGMHMNSLGSFLMSNSDYDGSPSEMINSTMETLQHDCGGGVTINHPYWSGLTTDEVLAAISTGGVIAIEIWNATCQQLNGKGYSLDMWDTILSKGQQIYGTAVPDHEAQQRPTENRQPFGYNHMLVINKTEEEILSAYRIGHFYTTLYNDGLLLKNYTLSGSTLTIEVSEASTFVFKTATRMVSIDTATTTATFTIASDDIYVRAEATRGNNKLFTNAIMI